MKKPVLVYLALAIAIITANAGCLASQFQKADLIALYTDGKYDFDFILLELRGGDNISALKQWTRPIVSRVFGDDGQVLGEFRGMGILIGPYIVTASVIIPFFPPEDILSNLRIETFLAGGLVGAERVFDLEPLDRVFVSQADDVAIFKRRGAEKYPIAPVPPYTMGKPGDLKELMVLVTVGYEEYLTKNELALPIKNASVTANWEDQKGFLFQDSATLADLGAPVFALRDGKPELVGMIIASGISVGVETQILAVRIDYIAKLLQEKAGVRLYD